MFSNTVNHADNDQTDQADHSMWPTQPVELLCMHASAGGLPHRGVSQAEEVQGSYQVGCAGGCGRHNGLH